MQIGFPNNPSKPLLKEIEWVGRNGFDYFELFLEPPMASPDKINPVKIVELLDKYGMKAVGHLPWYFPIGSSDNNERKMAIGEISSCIDFMKKVGIEKFTIHANWHIGMSEKKNIEMQSKSLMEIAEYAEKREMMPMLELMDTPKDNEKNIGAILEAVPDIGLNLDIGHANLSGRNPSKFIERFHSRICHIHMHDNDGVTDMHLPIGQGIIDWKSVIKTLKMHYDGTITLEIFHGGKEFILLSKKRLLRYWNSA